MNTCHANDTLTLDSAYEIVNERSDACRTCTELAWMLVGADLDRIDR